MPGRIFLDTNVLVYAHSATEPDKRQIAQALADTSDAMLSSQVLSEFGNVLMRKLGLAPAQARARVAALAQGCEVLLVDEWIILDAFRVAEKYGYGPYDSQIISAALHGGAQVLYSEDLQHGQVIDGVLAIQSPFRLAVREPEPTLDPPPSRSRAGKRN